MVKKRVKGKSKPNGFKDFFMNKYFVSAVFILIIVGGFFLISTLSQSEEAIAGEAYRRSIASKSPEPFFQMYKEYKRFYEKSGEGKITFRKFNAAVIRSNVFLIDSRKDYRNERAELKNSYSSIRKLVNKVYAGASSDTISLTAWYMVFEDRYKTEIFGQTFDKPINPTFFRKVSKFRSGEKIIVEKETKRSSRNSLTGAAVGGGNSGGTAFSDCAEGDDPKASGDLVGTSVDPMGPTGTGSSGQPTPYSEGGNGDPCGNLDPNKVGFGSSVGEVDDEDDDWDDAFDEMDDMEMDDNTDDNLGDDTDSSSSSESSSSSSNSGSGAGTESGSSGSGGSDPFGEVDAYEEKYEEEGTYQEIGTSSSSGKGNGGSSQQIGEDSGDDCGGAGSNPAGTLSDCAGGDDEDDCDDMNLAGMSDQDYASSGCGGGGADPAMVMVDITQSHISGYNPIDAASMNKLGLSTIGGELFIMLPK